MENKFMIDVENKLHGMHTRAKELHYSSKSMSIHKTIDEFDKELDKFDDALLENAMAIWGTIQPGTLSPILPTALEFGELLKELCGLLITIKQQYVDVMNCMGIINCVEGFYQTVMGFLYQYERIELQEVNSRCK